VGVGSFDKLWIKKLAQAMHPRRPRMQKTMATPLQAVVKLVGNSGPASLILVPGVEGSRFRFVECVAVGLTVLSI